MVTAITLSGIGAEGGALSRLPSEPLPQDWRAASIPLFWEGDIHKLALHYKHDPNGGTENEGGGKQVRFIFDLRLDHMGAVQLDGLIGHDGILPAADFAARTSAATSSS